MDSVEGIRDLCGVEDLGNGGVAAKSPVWDKRPTQTLWEKFGEGLEGKVEGWSLMAAASSYLSVAA